MYTISFIIFKKIHQRAHFKILNFFLFFNDWGSQLIKASLAGANLLSQEKGERVKKGEDGCVCNVDHGQIYSLSLKLHNPVSKTNTKDLDQESFVRLEKGKNEKRKKIHFPILNSDLKCLKVQIIVQFLLHRYDN